MAIAKLRNDEDDLVKRGAEALVRIRLMPALKKLMDVIDINPAEAARALRPMLAELEPDERKHVIEGLRYAETLFKRIHEMAEEEKGN
jgi:hypothetical protein